MVLWSVEILAQLEGLAMRGFRTLMDIYGCSMGKISMKSIAISNMGVQEAEREPPGRDREINDVNWLLQRTSTLK